jgi:hypothetical protein
MSAPQSVVMSGEPTPVNPPPKRLNPKLTRKAKPPPLEEQKESLGIEVTNPRLHLLHSGTWVPKEFENGRYVENTGIWSCCCDEDKFSLYCEV